MLLKELFAKDIDLSEYDKKLIVNIFQGGEDGVNVKDLYALEKNPINLRGSKEDLLDYGFIEQTDRRDFFIVTSKGKEAMDRASLIDENGELSDVHASKYFYDEKMSDDLV